MSASAKVKLPDLHGKVAIITGNTRGIGRVCSEALAACGCKIVVTGKSENENPNLPGTIYSVASEIAAKYNVETLPVKLDMRSTSDIDNLIAEVVKKFKRIDILISNASALWWHTIEKTPISKYDLITGINTRGAFYIVQKALPIMKAGGFGRVICMSPPISTDPASYKGYTAYNISKYGMTMVALGVASEYGPSSNITGNSLWPATIIESYASINFDLGERSNWRKATILSDCVLLICGSQVNGQQLIDDEYLEDQAGLTQEDLKVYRYDPNHEPLRLLAPRKERKLSSNETARSSELASKYSISRGDVKVVNKDRKTDHKRDASRL